MPPRESSAMAAGSAMLRMRRCMLRTCLSLSGGRPDAGSHALCLLARSESTAASVDAGRGSEDAMIILQCVEIGLIILLSPIWLPLAILGSIGWLLWILAEGAWARLSSTDEGWKRR